MSSESYLPGSSLSLQVLRDENVLQARIHGPLNMETAPLCEERLSSMLGSSCVAVSLDLGGAEYVDSDGVRWLQQMRTELGKRGIGFRIAVRDGSRVERTLRLLRLENDFLIDRFPEEESKRPLSAAA